MPPIEGRIPNDLVERALKPLWACWRALFAARQKRDPLELDLPERRVMLDEKGRIMSIAPRDRLTKLDTPSSRKCDQLLSPIHFRRMLTQDRYRPYQPSGSSNSAELLGWSGMHP